MRPKLTIAIPTYNRCSKLEECVNRVIEYCRGLDVEIIISDNASTDNTQEIVARIIKENPEIRYYRNSENLGFDGNFFNCFKKAWGEYVWLLSDDDILLPGAIESVLTGLEKDPVCMHLNSSGIENEEPLVVGEPRFKVDGLKEYKDRNAFIEEIGIFCTFVSSLVFKTDFVKKIENKEKYFKTNILQSNVFFETMKNDGVYTINTFNCLAARGNKTVHYDILRTWVKSYSDLLLTVAPECGFDSQRMSEVLRDGLATSVYDFVLTFRQTCDHEKDWDCECIWPYIERYPELVNMYKEAVNCPIGKLKWLKLKQRIKRKIKHLYGR